MPRLTLFLLVLVAAALSGCGGASDTPGGGDSSAEGASVNLVAYSTPQVVYDEIIPAFEASDGGKGTGFKTSFGASGDQSRAVAEGQPADVVSFSVEPDMQRLVEAGLVGSGWRDTPTDGLVSTSVVSFVVRKGNPKNIRSWDDLLRKDVKVLTPNPFTSGAAKWNLLAAYGQASNGGKDPQAGLDYVRKLLTEQVPVQDKSGREALQNFINNQDVDVLLSYEYEATTAQKQGEADIEYVIPDDTIKIDITIAETKQASPAAGRFLDFVLSKDGQQKFVDWGYRPVDKALLEANRDKFPDPPGLFTIEDLGGWERVDDELFDVEKGSIAKIEEAAGVSTAS